MLVLISTIFFVSLTLSCWNVVMGDTSMPSWAFLQIIHLVLQRWSLLQKYGIQMVGHAISSHQHPLVWFLTWVLVYFWIHISSLRWFCCLLCNFSVYPDGKVCISILHPPGDDPNGYELASERWSPVHTVHLRHSNLCSFLILYLFRLLTGKAISITLVKNWCFFSLLH